jgi:hypothetical protein
MNCKPHRLALPLAFLGLVACQQGQPQLPPTYLRVDKALFAQKLHSQPALYLSCVRCDCMVDELNSLYRRKPQLLRRFTFFADTHCIKRLDFKHGITHSPQLFLDSVYDENYGVLVFRRQADTIEGRLIKTEEVLDMGRILEGY